MNTISTKVTCPACRGDKVVLTEDTPNISGSYLEDCPNCGGSGFIYETEDYHDSELPFNDL